MRLPCELDLLVGLLRYSYDQEAADLIVRSDLDWDRFLRLARFHRIQGIAAAAAATASVNIPTRVATALNADARDIARRNLQAALASAELHHRFLDAGIDLLFVKGLTLSVRAYGNAWTKAAVDVDVLIGEEQLAAAADLLTREGWHLVTPRQRRALAATHHLRKESEWRHDGLGVQLDLHTRLSDNTRLISEVGINSPRQSIEVASGTVLPTLADDHLLTYLAVHGASSAWFRLKWITDFAALLHHTGQASEEVHRRAQELGAGRAIDQALMVADALYRILNSNRPLREKLAGDPSSRRLRAQALNYLCRVEPIEPTKALLGTAAIHTSQFLLSSSLGFKSSELLRQTRAVLFR